VACLHQDENHGWERGRGREGRRAGGSGGELDLGPGLPATLYFHAEGFFSVPEGAKGDGGVRRQRCIWEVSRGRRRKRGNEKKRAESNGETGDPALPASVPNSGDQNTNTGFLLLGGKTSPAHFSLPPALPPSRFTSSLSAPSHASWFHGRAPLDYTPFFPALQTVVAAAAIVVVVAGTLGNRENHPSDPAVHWRPGWRKEEGGREGGREGRCEVISLLVLMALHDSLVSALVRLSL